MKYLLVAFGVLFVFLPSSVIALDNFNGGKDDDVSEYSLTFTDRPELSISDKNSQLGLFNSVFNPDFGAKSSFKPGLNSNHEKPKYYIVIRGDGVKLQTGMSVDNADFASQVGRNEFMIYNDGGSYDNALPCVYEKASFKVEHASGEEITNEFNQNTGFYQYNRLEISFVLNCTEGNPITGHFSFHRLRDIVRECRATNASLEQKVNQLNTQVVTLNEKLRAANDQLTVIKRDVSKARIYIRQAMQQCATAYCRRNLNLALTALSSANPR